MPDDTLNVWIKISEKNNHRQFKALNDEQITRFFFTLFPIELSIFKSFFPSKQCTISRFFQCLTNVREPKLTLELFVSTIELSMFTSSCVDVQNFCNSWNKCGIGCRSENYTMSSAYAVPFFVHVFLTSLVSSRLCRRGSIPKMKSRAESGSPWRTPLLIFIFPLRNPFISRSDTVPS